MEAGASEKEALYSHLFFQFRLPYCPFLDDDDYYVTVKGVQWRVILKTVAKTRIEWGTPQIDFGLRAQLHLDNHGYSGVTEVVVGRELPGPRNHSELIAVVGSKKEIALSDALIPVNRLIALYRVKTLEHWFRPLGETDILIFRLLILPLASSCLQFFMAVTNARIASGYPYVKTINWYADLRDRARSEEPMPLMVDVIAERRDAFARGNLRLVATDFALAVKALFRELLAEYFPSEKLDRRAQDLLAAYYRRYREIADAASLSVTKKQALSLLRTVWGPRDLLMHGHDVPRDPVQVKAAEIGILRLLELWQKRPGAKRLLIEGPFAEDMGIDFPSRNSGELLERVISRLSKRDLFGAEDAARWATMRDPNNTSAYLIATRVAEEQGRIPEAIDHLQRALKSDPSTLGAREELERLLTPQASAGDSGGAVIMRKATGARNQQTGRAGEYFIAVELSRRGAYAVPFAGNMPRIDILASNLDRSRTVSLQVKTRRAGTWQTSIDEGRRTRRKENETDFWVLVDLHDPPDSPEFYVVPAWWIRRSIYREHHGYLARKGGARAVNPSSKHHSITMRRIRQRKDRWDLLRLF